MKNLNLALSFSAFLAVNLGSIGFAQAACPDLSGVFREDDYGLTVQQESCEKITLLGRYVFEKIQYKDLTTDSKEVLCYEEGNYREHCAARWDGNTLIIDIRKTMGEITENDFMKITRCDLTQPNCKYGVMEPKDTLRVDTLHSSEVLIPRFPKPL